MRNPLHKRLPRELKSELGKYLVIFLFLTGMIAFVSGFLVASDSMSAAYREGFDKYNIEDGNFTLEAEASDALLARLAEENLTLYPNFYIESDTEEVESTLRIFALREKLDLACLMEGAFPAAADEIAIDRMYADNNELAVGDTLTVGGQSLRIAGLVALSDYSALYEDPGDMMFDAVKFGVAVTTAEGFAACDDTHLHYSYAWQYEAEPADDAAAKTKADAFLQVLATEAAASGNAVTNYSPAYNNPAICFAGDDIQRDGAMITIFLYIVILIIAFIFAITASNTITKEAMVIGTLRASGYSKGELIRHYLTMPVLVMLVAAAVGNVLGYTWLKSIAASMYYGSYSLPTFETRWNADAFLKTTLIPVLILFCINLFVLVRKLSLSPLQFIRRDLHRRQKKKAFRLNSRIGILKRFRLRVVLQNMPNYLTILFGIFLANAILLFGLMFTPLLDYNQQVSTDNMIASYQYVLKTPADTKTAGAEKYCANALKTIAGKRKSEEVTLYGVCENSRYLNLSFDGDGVYISDAYANKYDVGAGDTITLREPYGDQEYTLQVAGIYPYPAAIAVFLQQAEFNRLFDQPEGAFNGYFSEQPLTDLDERAVASVITLDDLTRTSRQLRLSIGSLMNLFLVFGVVMFMLIIYLLSKLIIEKNAQSISMTKILGYSNREINSLYSLTTSIVVVLSLLATIPLVNLLMKWVCIEVFASFPGWLAYYVPFSVFVKMAALGIAAYSGIAFLQTRKIKQISMRDALKNAE